MAAVHPLEDAAVAEDVARLGGSGRFDWGEAYRAKGGGLRCRVGDGEDWEMRS